MVDGGVKKETKTFFRCQIGKVLRCCRSVGIATSLLGLSVACSFVCQIGHNHVLHPACCDCCEMIYLHTHTRTGLDSVGWLAWFTVENPLKEIEAEFSVRPKPIVYIECIKKILSRYFWSTQQKLSEARESTLRFETHCFRIAHYSRAASPGGTYLWTGKILVNLTLALMLSTFVLEFVILSNA